MPQLPDQNPILIAFAIVFNSLSNLPVILYFKMVKDHNVKLSIKNRSGFTTTYAGDWFDSGRLADDYNWPGTISNDDHQEILCYERDWSAAGCSGYVQYNMSGTVLTIAFSNPSVGTNKLGVGTTGKDVWDDMDNHSYQPFVIKITIAGKELNFNCQCTGGSTNSAEVSIFQA